ncbi:hypothetical protein RclHR1_12320004 [Rhizophagus clarus]|uniref:Ricin B lectin domain-containing protein n=1 Tax=Rhizophagus clarus TaxID=94130 RepID=A0A2Z6Q6V5_9GLOM|nr:hypothetical protein RclHR1_12320004 [Rhizophagus clarus]GES85144.1 hypothetical protein RCL_jg1225.t1 [Rhizophagus clarus]
MKFNLFLLLLTTLITVALSTTNKITGNKKIQSVGKGRFWGINGKDVSLLTSSSNDHCWEIVRRSKDEYTIFTSKDRKDAVQYDGFSSTFKIAKYNSTSLAQRWIIGSTDNVEYYILTSEKPSVAATAFLRWWGWSVSGFTYIAHNPYQKWRFLN